MADGAQAVQLALARAHVNTSTCPQKGCVMTEAVKISKLASNGYCCYAASACVVHRRLSAVTAFDKAGHPLKAGRAYH